MPLPDKRSALQTLTKARLRELVEAFELKLAAAENKDAHVDILARARRVPLDKLLEALLRDELKDICRIHGLDEGGREKAVLVARLLGQPTPTQPDDAPDPSIPPPREAPVHPPWRDTGPLEPGQLVTSARASTS